jgi:hypothetical protein
MRQTLRLAVAAATTILVSTTVVVAGQTFGFRVHPAPEWLCPDEMHDYYMRRFEIAEGFGLSRMPQPPMLDRSGVLELRGERYTIQRLELVGLLKRAAPVVYVPMRHNVRFDPADFKSRSLTPFETRALAELREGRHIVSAAGDGPGTIEVVGALRGDGSCLKCHTDQREGDLLGAFSYSLRRVPAPRGN